MGNQTLGTYTVISKLGKGYFGKSRHVETTDNYPFSIKILQVLPDLSKQKIMNDVHKFLNNLNQNSIKFRQVIDLKGNCFGIVQQYCAQGNLANHLLIMKQFKYVLLQMKQISFKLSLLHKKQTFHGNLKPTNILLKQGSLFLFDMISPLYIKSLRLRNSPGAYDYFPKQFYQGILTTSSDVWSLGIIFIEMFLGKRIRQIQNIKDQQKPSINRDNYPSASTISLINHQSLREIIIQMLKPDPILRISIEEIIKKIDQINEKQLKSLRLVALNQAIKLDINQHEFQHKNPQYLKVKIDLNLPNIRNFSIIGNVVKRMDDSKTRLQVVAQQKIPIGIWIISVRILDYGQNNDQIAFGFTTEEKRRQKMSGDIDQYGSLAYWSNIANKNGNLCINGQWTEQKLPFLKPQNDVLQIICDTINRQIKWHINENFIQASKMPKSYWDQSLYFFIGMMGRNCTVKIQTKGQIS